jgi:hypothetical protein
MKDGGFESQSEPAKSKSAKSLHFKSDFELVPPSTIIFKILDDAAQRTFAMGTQEFGLVGGHIFTHNSVGKDIDNYLKRLFDEWANDLQDSDVPSQDKGHSKVQKG